jgi:hypothetical protein
MKFYSFFCEQLIPKTVEMPASKNFLSAKLIIGSYAQQMIELQCNRISCNECSDE